MSYYSGETLKQRLERGPMTIVEVMTAGGAIAAGLAAAQAPTLFTAT